MAGHFSEPDEERCAYYAGYLKHLDRYHFDILYWILFMVIVCSLFLASWIFQWTMMCRDKPNYCENKYRRKLKLSIGLTTIIFLYCAACLVIEVYALMALQFCDGEDLMSLYWSTWMTLQVGSEIAILGVVLALWHHAFDVRHPLWALALGTPVLVVAGFGHVLSFAFEHCWKRHKTRKKAKSAAQSLKSQGPEKGNNGTPSDSASITRAPSSSEEPMRAASILETGQSVYLTIDMGDDERVKGWPSFVGMSSDNKAIIEMTAVPHIGGTAPSNDKAEKKR